ncbi:uncharacterized mitochondrial protein-like protein, partial [Tanacetum coccineum]
RFENVSKHSSDLLLARGNTLRSDEDRLKLNELMALCTTLQNKVLDLEKTKTTQHNEIASLKRRVKKLEKKDRSRIYRLKRLYKVGLTTRVESSDNEESLGEDASKQGRINSIDADEEITKVSVHDMNVSAGEEVFVTTVDDITLAQVLEEMKSTKRKKKGVVIQELGESRTTISSQLSSQQSQDKGKGIFIEPVKPMNKKDLIRLDEETALNLQVEFDEKERLTREKAEKEKEANIALIETWDDIHAKIDADHQLAERMQAQEQEELREKKQTTNAGIKSLLNVVSITTALIDVNAAQSKLVLLENFNENYSKCLRLLYKVNAAEGVNAASEEVSTAELVSTAYNDIILAGNGNLQTREVELDYDNAYPRLKDTIIRWRRMAGYNTLEVPGMDHAGIATQVDFTSKTLMMIS